MSGYSDQLWMFIPLNETTVHCIYMTFISIIYTHMRCISSSSATHNTTLWSLSSECIAIIIITCYTSRHCITLCSLCNGWSAGGERARVKELWSEPRLVRKLQNNGKSTAHAPIKVKLMQFWYDLNAFPKTIRNAMPLCATHSGRLPVLRSARLTGFSISFNEKNCEFRQKNVPIDTSRQIERIIKMIRECIRK